MKKNYFEIAKLLINKGADVNVDNGYLLIKSISQYKIEFIKLLLESGIDPNIRNHKPLLMANNYVDGEISNLLIKYGATLPSKI